VACPASLRDGAFRGILRKPLVGAAACDTDGGLWSRAARTEPPEGGGALAHERWSGARPSGSAGRRAGGPGGHAAGLRGPGGAVTLDGLNFLAHLYLADPSPESMLGNLLPDLHRGRLDTSVLSTAVQNGVIRHRRVDAFTDTHPVFERSRARLRGELGHFAGVVVDVIYDHCLSVGWTRYHPQPRTAFLEEAYAGLREGAGVLAPRTRVVLAMLCDEDWITPYGCVEGVRHTLVRLSARVFERSGRRVRLETAADVLEREPSGFFDDFSEFFPELMHYVGIDHREARC